MHGAYFYAKEGEYVDEILWHQNKKSFLDVCHGKYGRKVIYSNVPEVNAENVLRVMGNSMYIHNQNRREIDYLYHYVSGDQPILYRVKDVRPEIKNDVVENHALEVVRFMTAQTYGEPIQYVSMKKSDNENENLSSEIDKLNDYMRSLDKEACDVEIGDWQSTCGTAYRETWSKPRDTLEPGEPAMGIGCVDPRNNFIVYSSRHGHKPLCSFSKCWDEEDQEYWLCTTPKRVFEIKAGKITSDLPNGHGRVLLVEYPNNVRRLSDVEVTITMTDAMNKIQSNRVDGVEQFVQAFIKFVNCEIDEDTFIKMCKIGALKVKTVNPSFPADVSMVSAQLDQQQTQTSKDDIYKNFLIIQGMPSREQNTGGDTGQAVYLRNGWDFAEQRAKIDEPITKRSEKEFLRIALNILKTKNQISKELNVSDIDIKINRNNTDNMLVKSQALIYLLEKGIHPKIAIRTVGLWSDPEKVYLESKPYLDAKYKVSEEDLETQSKKAELFVKFLNAGFSPEESGQRSGLGEVDSSKNPSFQKWSYDGESGEE